jgi:hypothetical protein
MSVLVQGGRITVSMKYYLLKNIFENILPALIHALSQGHSGQFRMIPALRMQMAGSVHMRQEERGKSADAIRIQRTPSISKKTAIYGA